MQVNSYTDTERNLAVELILEDIPGGGTVENDDFPTSSSGMKAGALLGKASDGIWHLTKTAMLVEGVGTTASGFEVLNNHEFKVGDYLTVPTLASSGTAITAISASGTGNDVIEVYWEGPAVAASGLIVAASGIGASPMKYPPTAIASNSFSLDDENTGVGLMVRGRVVKNLQPYYTDATLRALFPLVRFV